MVEIEIDKIIIGDRFRKEFGDITSLANNIMEVGLLHPVVINEKNELIAGYRRIKAYQFWLWKTIPCTIVSVDDARKAELSENKERKDFTITEIKAVVDYLKPKLEKEAEERQKATRLVGKGIQEKETNGASNLDEPMEAGRTDEILASYVGVGKDTLRKIITIAEEGTEDEIKEADSKNRQISMVFSKLRSRLTGAHVGNATGEYEWYTPSIYIEAAREVMGSIDVDPASSEVADKTVKATKYYTIESDGLIQKWEGNVWMNPPYSQPLITDFCNLLIDKYLNGEIKRACVLVNNATETNFYQNMLNHSKAVCFIKGRVKFIDKNGESTGAPLQGQTILYFGDNYREFGSIFSQFGVVLYATC